MSHDPRGEPVNLKAKLSVTLVAIKPGRAVEVFDNGIPAWFIAH
jgi:hypothetical protein